MRGWHKAKSLGTKMIKDKFEAYDHGPSFVTSTTLYKPKLFQGWIRAVLRVIFLRGSASSRQTQLSGRFLRGLA
jgi:hypothetical protein